MVFTPSPTTSPTPPFPSSSAANAPPPPQKSAFMDKEGPSSDAARLGSQQPTFTAKPKGTAKRFFSAYAQTWVGMSTIWLMGEALIPGRKVGGTFKKGVTKLSGAGEEILEIMGKEGKDAVVVILDKHFRHVGEASPPYEGAAAASEGGSANWEESSRQAAEVIRAAGEHALVTVSTSFNAAHDQLKSSSPGLKRAVQKHGRDVILLIDKSLKNPIVVTGVHKFARSKGIPYSEALLRLASFGLSKILAHLPEEVADAVSPEAEKEAGVREMTAEELERGS